MMFTQAHQLATFFLLFAASSIEAKSNHRSFSKRAHEDAVHARRDVASSPTAVVQIAHNEHIVNADTLRQAIQEGRKSQQAKAGKLSLDSYAQAANVTATNIQNTYTVPLLLGQDQKTYSLIVDTGSSVTWVGAQTSNPYDKSSTTQDTHQSIGSRYGSGSFSGELYLDTVRLGDLTLPNQGVGGATTSEGFSNVDGIIGFGPTSLTKGVLSPNTTGTVTTITDNAYDQQKIPADILGVYFAPTYQTSEKNGELTLGGIDSSRVQGSVQYTPKSTQSDVNDYWGVNMAVTSGNTTLFSRNGGIVDTGTTAIYFPSDAFQIYTSLIPGAELDTTAELLRIPKGSLDSVPDLLLTFEGGMQLKLNKYAQLIDPSVQGSYGLSSNYYYSWVSDVGQNSGTNGLDFILGQKFLEHYYSVYDTENSRVGFGYTSHSNPTGFQQ